MSEIQKHIPEELVMTNDTVGKETVSDHPSFSEWLKSHNPELAHQGLEETVESHQRHGEAIATYIESVLKGDDQNLALHLFTRDYRFAHTAGMGIRSTVGIGDEERIGAIAQRFPGLVPERLLSKARKISESPYGYGGIINWAPPWSDPGSDNLLEQSLDHLLENQPLAVPSPSESIVDINSEIMRPMFHGVPISHLAEILQQG